ncbi:MAG TPA: hypothetical protein EYO07_05185, partial [Candidatus Marinimicrobia bacterium]|nr:hypothetical protein [Candidatus Neomarinimicrobiota bacterium]
MSKNVEKTLFLTFIVQFAVLTLLSAETVKWDKVDSQTGNRLAVLEFQSTGISTPMKTLLTQQFRETLRKLNIYDTLDEGFNNR